jgi:hypothetical protein
MSTIGHLRDTIIAASSHKEQSIRELETVVNHLNLFLIRSTLPFTRPYRPIEIATI